MAEPYLLLFTFSTFSLQLRIWNPQNATIATEWQLAFEQPPTFKAVVLTFAHPIFIWGIFQTPERRIEGEITTEEHATSCEMLSLTCFWGNKQTESVLWSVYRQAFSTSAHAVFLLSMRGCSFQCWTVSRQPFYTTLSFIWFDLRCKRGTNADAVIANAHTPTLCVELHKSAANSAVNILLQSVKSRSIEKWWQRVAYTERNRECHSTPVLEYVFPVP